MFYHVCKICVDIQPHSITEVINRCFDKLYDRQAKILVKKFWEKTTDGLIYINKDFFNCVKYDITPKQIATIFDSYLAGVYDEKLEEVVACYTYCLFNICSLHEKTIYSNLAEKYERNLKLRWCNISEFKQPKYFITGSIPRKIVNIFDSSRPELPNQYVYGYFYEYDCCFKEEYEKLVDYVLKIKITDFTDVGVLLFTLCHIFNFLNFSRFKPDDFFAHRLAKGVLQNLGFSECIEWDSKHMLFKPFDGEKSVYDFRWYNATAEGFKDIYTELNDSFTFSRLKLTKEEIDYALFKGKIKRQ